MALNLNKQYIKIGMFNEKDKSTVVRLDIYKLGKTLEDNIKRRDADIAKDNPFPKKADDYHYFEVDVKGENDMLPALYKAVKKKKKYKKAKDV